MSIERQVAIVNVGANAKHYKRFGKIKSPLFKDQRFEFVPIPAGRLASKCEIICDEMKNWPRYRELRSFYNVKQDLARYLPERTSDKWLNQPMHNDPNFPPASDRITYGDYYGEGNSRAKRLWELGPNDYILFIAHLWNWTDHDGFEGKGSFYLVGFIEIERIVKLNGSDKKLLERYQKNPHAMEWLNRSIDPKAEENLDFENHKIFVGTENSLRFQKAVPFNWDIAFKALRDVNGKKLERSGGTELSRIGSYTRSVVLIKGIEAKERKRIIWNHIREHSGSKLTI